MEHGVHLAAAAAAARWHGDVRLGCGKESRDLRRGRRGVYSAAAAGDDVPACAKTLSQEPAIAKLSLSPLDDRKLRGGRAFLKIRIDADGTGRRRVASRAGR